MTDRNAVLQHTMLHYPLDGLHDLGYGLGAGTWDRDTEFARLGDVFARLRSDADWVAIDTAELAATTGRLSSADNIPRVICVVRRGIFNRNLAGSAEVDPVIDSAMDWDGHGAHGDEGKVEALGAAFLIDAFVDGLDAGGFPRKAAKGILRDDIERVLSEGCDGKSSYAAISWTRFAYRVMKYSMLHTPESRVRQIKRGGIILKSFGLELADF